MTYGPCKDVAKASTIHGCSLKVNDVSRSFRSVLADCKLAFCCNVWTLSNPVYMYRSNRCFCLTQLNAFRIICSAIHLIEWRSFAVSTMLKPIWNNNFRCICLLEGAIHLFRTMRPQNNQTCCKVSAGDSNSKHIRELHDDLRFSR